MNHYAEDGDEGSESSCVVYRAGTIFPEMKDAKAWVESGSVVDERGSTPAIFGSAGPLDYSGRRR